MLKYILILFTLPIFAQEDILYDQNGLVILNPPVVITINPIDNVIGENEIYQSSLFGNSIDFNSPWMPTIVTPELRAEGDMLLRMHDRYQDYLYLSRIESIEIEKSNIKREFGYD